MNNICCLCIKDSNVVGLSSINGVVSERIHRLTGLCVSWNKLFSIKLNCYSDVILQPNKENLKYICASCSRELERGELLWKIYKSTIIKNVFGDGHKNNQENLVSMKTNDYLMSFGKDELNIFETSNKGSPITPSNKSRRSELTPKIPSQCPHCGKLIKNMARHIKEIHERKDASKCQLCSREFARKSSLKDHIRSAHKS